MKKLLLSLCVATATLFAFTACGGDPDPRPTPESDKDYLHLTDYAQITTTMGMYYNEGLVNENVGEFDLMMCGGLSYTEYMALMMTGGTLPDDMIMMSMALYCNSDQHIMPGTYTILDPNADADVDYAPFQIRYGYAGFLPKGSDTRSEDDPEGSAFFDLISGTVVVVDRKSVV